MRRLLVTVGCLAVAGCAAGSGAGSTGAASVPAPVAHDSPAPASNVARSTGGRGSAVTYRPVNNAGYTFHRLDSLTLHLPGGALQQQSLERTAYLHLTLTEVAGGNYRATIVLDSLQAAASAVAVPADSLAPVRGTRWTATVGPSGLLSRLVADRSTTLGDQLTSHLQMLFPRLPAGGARAGAEWTDSTEFPLRADVFDATEWARTRYRANDDGNKGLKIESSGTYTRSGKGKRFDQQLEMAASGTRQGIYRIGRDGALSSVDGSDSGEMTITVPSAGQTVPVTQSARYQIRATGR